MKLGAAARNNVKIKVRQPLAELTVMPSNLSEREAINRFADQLKEELNVRRVTLHEATQGSLLNPVIKPNMKSLGPKFGPDAQKVATRIKNVDLKMLIKMKAEGTPLTIWSEPEKADEVEFGPSDFDVAFEASPGWAGANDRGLQVALDAQITDDLAREGMAREIVRHVQDTRKKAGLEMEDRIELSLETTSDKLRQAIDAHRDYIAAETLATKWVTGPIDGDAHRADVSVDGQPLRIELRKVTGR